MAENEQEKSDESEDEQEEDEAENQKEETKIHRDNETSEEALITRHKPHAYFDEEDKEVSREERKKSNKK